MKQNELRTLLDGLDTAHAEVVHSFLRFYFVNEGLQRLIDREMMEDYWRLCELFFKEKNGSVLPALNEVCCRIVDAVEEEVKMGVMGEGYLMDSMEVVKRLAGKPVKMFAASLRDEMHVAERKDDAEGAFEVLSPLVLKMAEEVECGCYEEAAGNFLAFFDCLANIRARHGEWFEHLLTGGDISDMVYLTDAAAAVYCHLRQRDDLPKDLGEDMDSQLLLLNEQTGLFGDWTLSIYADMLYTDGYQSEDYSDLDNCEVWLDLKDCVQEVT